MPYQKRTKEACSEYTDESFISKKDNISDKNEDYILTRATNQVEI